MRLGFDMSVTAVRFAVLIGVSLSVAGCSSSESNAPSGGPLVVSGPVDAHSAPSVIERLQRQKFLSAADHVLLGDAYLACSNPGSAQNAYFNALGKGDLTPELRYRAQFGLGRTSEMLGSPFVAGT